MTEWTADTRFACGWSFDDALCTPCTDKVTEANTPVFQHAVDVAAEILYALSGRQFGVCELTVRPCRTDECSPCNMTGPRWTPLLVGGQWHNVACGSCTDSCSCTTVCDLTLPGPIDSVIEVKIDGQVQPLTRFRVDNRRTIVRKGENGECVPWPTCQDMAADDTEEGTYSIRYMRGTPLPEGGKRALATLACELFLDCLGDDCCALPKRVTSVTRQGITMAMLDPMDFIPNGKTGLYAVDLWLQSVNPTGRPRRSAIISPDMPMPRRETWRP